MGWLIGISFFAMFLTFHFLFRTMRCVTSYEPVAQASFA